MTKTDPLTGDPLPKSSNGAPKTDNHTPGEPLSIPSLDDCAKLSHADLLKLVERMACQCGLVAAMTDEQRRQLVKDRMTHIVAYSDDREAIAAGDKLLNRLDGTPVQTVDTRSVNVNVSRPASEGDSEILKRFYLDYHA